MGCYHMKMDRHSEQTLWSELDPKQTLKFLSTKQNWLQIIPNCESYEWKSSKDSSKESLYHPFDPENGMTFSNIRKESDSYQFSLTPHHGIYSLTSRFTVSAVDQNPGDEEASKYKCKIVRENTNFRQRGLSCLPLAKFYVPLII